MGWLSNLVQNREISRLETLLKTAPAPSIYLRLSQLYAESGDQKKSRQMILTGGERFPDDQTLKEANLDYSNAAVNAEIEQLKQRIEQFPNAPLFAKLALLYLKKGQAELCDITCKAGIKQHPHYGGIYLVLAKLALHKEDHAEAIEHLQKTIEFDKYNHDAMIMLAEEMILAGDNDSAREKLDAILKFAPEDEEVCRLLRRLDNPDEDSGDIDSKPEAVYNRPSLEDTRLESLDRLTSEVSALTNNVPVEVTANESQKGAAEVRLQTSLEELSSVPGVSGCMVIEKGGLIVASIMPESENEDLTAALITSIYRSTAACEEDFNLGEIDECVLESEGDTIHLLSLKEFVIAVIATKKTKSGLLKRALRTFAEHVLDTI